LSQFCKTNGGVFNMNSHPCVQFPDRT
jgi:hypothetical protein